MRIYVDADACPVVRQTEEVAHIFDKVKEVTSNGSEIA